MNRSGLKIEFRAGARVDTLLRDKDLLGDFRKIGLTSLQIGIESYDQKAIDSLSKNYACERVGELSRHIREANIPLASAFLIIGNYCDDKASILRLLKMTKKLGFGTMQISALTPWPGTDLYHQLKKEGQIKKFDYRLYNFKNAILPTAKLTLKQVQRFRRSLFYRWWFNPLVFIRNVFDVHRRHLHFYTLFSIQPAAVLYLIVHKLGLWRLFWYNRIIDKIYKEHMELIKK